MQLNFVLLTFKEIPGFSNLNMSYNPNNNNLHNFLVIAILDCIERRVSCRPQYILFSFVYFQILHVIILFSTIFITSEHFTESKKSAIHFICLAVQQDWKYRAIFVVRSQICSTVWGWINSTVPGRFLPHHVLCNLIL